MYDGMMRYINSLTDPRSPMSKLMMTDDRDQCSESQDDRYGEARVLKRQLNVSEIYHQQA